jgi:hypothetical protein
MRVVFIACCVSVAQSVLAADSVSVRVGFRGHMHVGRWTPIVVTGVPAGTRAIDVLAADSDGVRVAYPLNESTDEPQRVWSGLLRTGRLDAEIELRFFSDDSPTWRAIRIPAANPAERRATRETADRRNPEVSSTTYVPLRQSEPIWLEVGTSGELLTKVAEVRGLRFESWPDAAAVPWGLDSIDGIWIDSHLSLSEAALSELRRWLTRGGQLVLTVSMNADEFEQTPWSSLLESVTGVAGRMRTHELSGIESFTVHSRKIANANRSPVTILAPKQARTLAATVNGALIVRAAFGSGQVTVLGVDPAVLPISRWEGRDAFVRKLVLPASAWSPSKVATRSSLSQSGITDLASQWRAAVIHLPAVARPTLWSVLGLLLIYACLVGPLDYLVVHRLLKRPHWTWVTLPLWVSLACGGSLWLARAANGDAHQHQLTQLDVLDIDASTSTALARSWATAYSSQNDQWTITVEPPAELTSDASKNTNAVVTWLGFPEDASGGLYRTGGFVLGSAVCRTTSDRRWLQGIPMTQWSSKSFVAERSWTTTATSPWVEANLQSEAGGELTGTIVHHLPFELTDWLVAFENWVYLPHPKAGESARVWPAGQTWTPVDERHYGRVLSGFLTRTTATKRRDNKGTLKEDVLVEQERYNPLNLDPADILQMMTLHEAAGGKAYTGLDHHSLRAFDVSPLLQLDRAVVIARVNNPTTTWTINGKPVPPTRHDGFVRFLLPVKRVADNQTLRELPKFENEPLKPKQDAPNSVPDSASNETKSP